MLTWDMLFDWAPLRSWFVRYWWFRYLVYALLLLWSWLRPDADRGPAYTMIGVAVGVAVLLMLVWRLIQLKKPVEERTEIPDLIGLILAGGFLVYSLVLHA